MMKNKAGFVSIWVILWMAVLLPLLLFFVVDFPFYMYENNHLKSITDNAAATAVTQINEDMLKFGIIEIDEARAISAAKTIIASSLNLNSDLSPKAGDSLVVDAPYIEIKVFNNVPSGGMSAETPLGTVNIKKPSVYVYVEYKIYGVLFNKIVTMENLGMSQSLFRTN